MSQKNYSSNPNTVQNKDKSKALALQYNSNTSSKDEIQELKRKAQEAHLKMMKRKRAAVKIQKIARGYIARCKFEKIKRKLRLEREQKLREQKRKEYFAQNAPEIISNAIYTYICRKRYKEKLMLRKYINHCAVMIQANIRGVLTRRKYAVAQQHRQLFLRLLSDIIKGWKTRKCFKHRAVKRIILEIRELEQFEKDDDEEGGEKFRKSITVKLKSKKIELTKVYRAIYNQGMWMYKYTPDVSPVSNKFDDQRRGDYSFEEDQNYDNDNKRPTRGSQRRLTYDERDPSDTSFERVSQVSRNQIDDYDNRPIRGRGSNRIEDGRMSKNSQSNAWEDRENRPIGGRGQQNNWNEDPDAIPPSRGSRRGTYNESNEIQSRGKRKLTQNAYEERENRPIGGNRGTPNPYEERDNMPIGGKRGALNAYEERENMPVGGRRGKNNFEEDEPVVSRKKKGSDTDDRPIKPAKMSDDNMLEENENENDLENAEDPEKKSQKQNFLKRKQKYDPRKAIEDSKKNTELANANIYKNKKSEDLRNAIKAARGVPEEEKEASHTEAPLPKQKKKVALDVPDDNEIEDRAASEDAKERKFHFLKRKSKAMEAQKLDWKKTSSRIDCWGKKDAEVSRSPDRALSKNKVNVPKITKITKVQEHESQKNSPRPRTAAPKEEPKRSNMKSPDKRPATQARKESPPKKKKLAAPQSQNANHAIKLEDLEKAYTANFLNKYNNLTEKFYSENGPRDTKYEYHSIVPIIRQDSLFFKNYDSKNYHNAFAELDEEYQSLQTIS